MLKKCWKAPIDCLWTNQSDVIKRMLVVIGSILLFVSIYSIGKGYLSLQGIDEGLFTEFVGIVVTVFLIDGWRRIDTNVEIKKSLVRRAGSTSNETAKAAIDELRKTGWLARGVLKDADLSGANLQGAMLKDIDLSGTDLTNTNLDDAYLDNAILVGSKLCSASLKKTSMNGADLTGCDLRDAKLEETELRDAQFGTVTSLTGEVLPNFSYIQFSNCILDGVDFTVIENMVNSKFIDCSLNKAIFNRCNLSKSDFSGSELIGAKFEYATMTECKFPKSKLTGAKMKKANLDSANLVDATLKRAELNDANLANILFSGSNFNKAILYGADFTTNTREKASDPNDEDFIPAFFIDAEFDEDTTLPNGESWNHNSDDEMLKEFGMRREIEKNQVTNSKVLGRSAVDKSFTNEDDPEYIEYEDDVEHKE